LKRFFQESGLSIGLIELEGFRMMRSDDNGDARIFVLLLYLSVEQKPARIPGLDIEKDQIGLHESQHVKPFRIRGCQRRFIPAPLKKRFHGR